MKNKRTNIIHPKILATVLQVPVLFLLMVSCTPEETGSYIMTVEGPIPAEDMGTALIHEHVLVDWIGADSTGYHRWDRAEVVERVLPYFEEAAQHGVATIFECTPAYLGRDPFVLRELADRTGLHIVTNTGYYGAVDNRFMPAHAWQESAGEIAQRWIGEFEHGIDDSGVRPGFMKISVGEEAGLSDLHRKVVEAAIMTQRETGMAIVSHTIGDVPALEQIALIREAGLSPSVWVWTHAQSGSLEGNLQAAERGAWISLDNVNHDPSHEPGEQGSVLWYADRIERLRDAGHLNRVLLSHDAGWYDAGEPDGGDYRGYTDLFEHLIPVLQNRGFSEDEIRKPLVENPRKAFGIRN